MLNVDLLNHFNLRTFTYVTEVEFTGLSICGEIKKTWIEVTSVILTKKHIKKKISQDTG